jgi:hypothetical protein
MAQKDSISTERLRRRAKSPGQWTSSKVSCQKRDRVRLPPSQLKHSFAIVCAQTVDQYSNRITRPAELAASLLWHRPTTGVQQPAAKEFRGGASTLTGDEGDHMKRKLSGILVAAMALALIVGTSTRAEGAFMAAICNDIACSGTGDTIVTDGGVGDLDPTVGVILMSFATGGFTTNINVAQSKPAIGSPTAPQLDVNYTATGIGNAWLFATDTGFTGIGTPVLQIAVTQPPCTDPTAPLPCATGNTVDGRAWGGDSNTEFDITGNLLVNLPDLTTTPASASGTGPTVGLTFNPYSLTIGVNVIRTVAGTTTGDLNLMVVPEPATMALFGLGLMGFGAASRRRRQK